MEIIPAILAEKFEDGLRMLKQVESFAITPRRMMRNSPISN
jgi:hypothetical protein